VRVAEALTLLAVFSPVMIWAITIGCALANLIGAMTGANILGFMDVIIGTSASLAAGCATFAFRKIRTGKLPLVAALPPVIINGVVIGFSLMWMYAGTFSLNLFLINAMWVTIGQTIACFGLGVPLVYIMEKTGIAKRFLTAQPSERRTSHILH